MAGLALWLALACAPCRAEEFPAPPALAEEIAFWTRIYAEADSNGGLLHDERNLAVVYEWLRFPAELGDVGRQRLVDDRKAHYRRILQALAAGAEGADDPESRRVAELWGASAEPATLARAARRVRFQLGQADEFRLGLQRSGAWRGYIESALRQAGLPLELALLPQVESSFNPAAYSRLGAAGIWQFTRHTGRRYLRIDRVVDQRMDPFAATDAAIALLAQDYRLTGNWPLAVTAYNHGVSGVRRAVRQLGSERIEDLVEAYQSRSFGFASRNFYVSFRAALDVAAEAERHFGELVADPPASRRTLSLPGFIAAERLAEVLEISPEELRALNPALRSSVWRGRKLVPRNYPLRLPADWADRDDAELLAGFDAGDWRRSQTVDRTHRVRRGNTLSGIAELYGFSAAELAAYNGLDDRNFIRTGQVLHLPVGERSAAAASDDGRYRVRPGDSLWLIARRAGMNTAELARLNDLDDPSQLRPGQTLLVRFSPRAQTPAPAAPAPDLAQAADAAAPAEEPQVTADDPTDYAVAEDGSIEIQALETLGHYADWLSLATARLRRLNDLPRGRPLVVGRRLLLDLSRVPAAEFERRRVAYHRRVQQAYFARYRVTGTGDHRLRDGESLWVLAQRRYGIPVWLLRQFNPDLDPDRVRAGLRLVIPVVALRAADEQEEPAGGE